LLASHAVIAGADATKRDGDELALHGEIDGTNTDVFEAVLAAAGRAAARVLSALLYDCAEELIAAVAPFLAEGLVAEEAIVPACREEDNALLARALGDDGRLLKMPSRRSTPAAPTRWPPTVKWADAEMKNAEQAPSVPRQSSRSPEAAEAKAATGG